jgi:hypothetical protein
MHNTYHMGGIIALTTITIIVIFSTTTTAIN